MWSVFVLQVFLKEGVLNKLSRKVMQPRMFFLVQKKKTSFLYFSTYCVKSQHKKSDFFSVFLLIPV